MQGNDLDQVIAQIQARFPLRSRRECEETLEVVNNDVNKALAFLEYLGPRVPSNQTQDARVTSISQRRNSAQDVAGGDVRAGQKGVLKLSTTEWTPGEGFATGQRSMSVISAAPGPSGPTGPQNQMPSGSATTSKHKAYSICKYSHRFCIHAEKGDVDPVRKKGYQKSKPSQAAQRDVGAKKSVPPPGSKPHPS